MTSVRTDSVASFRFTDTELHDRRTYAVWRELIGRTVLTLDLEPLPDCRRYCDASTWFSPQLRILRFTASGMNAARTRSVLIDGNDDVTLQMVNSGFEIASHGGRQVLVSEGNAIPMWNATECAIALPRATRGTVVQISRILLTDVVPDLEDKLTRPDPIPRDQPTLRLLKGYLDLVTSAHTLSVPELAELTAAHVRDLLAVILGATRDGAARAEHEGVRAARLHAIKTDITRNLQRNDLSVAFVASRQGISARYAQALFETEGTTFSEFVLRRRLARARQLLADPDGIHRRIGEIAFEVGFGDLSYFNRSFRRQYGATPSDVRAAALMQRHR
jgi:AraC-like DNA-binding protein